MDTMMPRGAPAVKPKRSVRWVYRIEGRGGACGLLLVEDAGTRWHFGVSPIPGTDSFALLRCEPGEGPAEFVCDVRARRCGCRSEALPKGVPCLHLAALNALRSRGELEGPATK